MSDHCEILWVIRPNRYLDWVTARNSLGTTALMGKNSKRPNGKNSNVLSF